jgi:hypothetical protein
MKRLLGLVVLFVVLCVSVPSYGYFLIYNVSGSVKGVNNNAPASISWKGYLVLKISADSVLDANLITYGLDSTKTKVYVEHDFDATGAFKLGVTPGVNISSKGVLLTVDLVCDTVKTTFDFEGFTVGKAAYQDIGSGSKEWVASSAKGVMIVRQGKLLSSADDITGTGTVSSSLWTVGTKYVNQNSWTQDMIINTGDSHQKSLTQMLEAKGFNEVIP